ncbi:MAG TPA: FkbM family methyltransferase [Terracidiphilus sp.]|nr:FkbM family methyltransferase [Terracidiphilus sp.]
MTLAKALYSFNLLPVWRRTVNVWGSGITASSLDRLVNLCLHHYGLRGGEEKRFLERHVRPGMRVLDIGANQGIYSLLLSKLVGSAGHLHCFEPDPLLFASLSNNCMRSGATNIRLHNIGLGSTAGALTLYRSRLNSGDNRLAAGDRAEWFEPVEVKVSPLSQVLPEDERVDFIKLDVQGWEYQVFQGMRDLLRRNPRVRIYFEFWPFGLTNAGCAPKELLGYVSSEGFSLHHAENGQLKPVTDFDAFVRTLPGQKYTDLYAVRGAVA